MNDAEKKLMVLLLDLVFRNAHILHHRQGDLPAIRAAAVKAGLISS